MAPTVGGEPDEAELLGIGMSVLDLLQVVPAFPSEGGVTRAEASTLMGGGPVPTALCAAARFGIKAGIVERLGDDWCGRLLRDEFERHRVSVRHLQLEGGRTSSHAAVFVRKSDGERHFVFTEGDFTPLRDEELPREALARCRVLHLNGRHWPACVEAARQVRGHGGLVSFDGGAGRYETKFEELFPLVDLLVVAADFADRAVGEAPREEQLARLARRGASLVGITDGTAGSWFLDESGTRFHQPAFPAAPLVDTTGCGDVFHGVFLAALLQGEELTVCAAFASAAAALAATSLGGRGSLPTRKKVEAYIESCRNGRTED